ncbi:MAG: HIT family protein [Acidobacteria bacterium]|nr:HIT family protein [Acidobacteriota bacterium]
MDCPFCDPAPERIVAQNALALALRDGFPVSPGHTLAVPRRHVASWFDATDAERAALLALLDAVRETLLRTERPPDGFNLGINAGEAAGQTVPHLHVHLIPRYRGDVDDPTGGVRFVIPARGNYRRPGFIPAEAEP